MEVEVNGMSLDEIEREQYFLEQMIVELELNGYTVTKNEDT